MRTCPACGEANPDRAKFCMACSEALPATEEERLESRKTVTVLFCDMAGSTALGDRLDAETLRRVIGRYFDALSRAIERHGGTVEKFIGDAVMGVFGVPVVREDDALRAVRAAGDMKRALDHLNDELESELQVRLEIRIGINTGEVVVGDPASERSLATGDSVNVAARLEQHAPAGEIWIGRDTYRLVKDAIAAEPLKGLTVKGKPDALDAYRVVSIDPAAAGLTRRMDSPLVGRERQRALLRQVFDATVQERTCHLFTVLGTPGVGKSRLVLDLCEDITAQATVLQGRCLPYGEGITFWPLIEILRDAAGVMDSEDPEAATAKLDAFLSSDGGLPPGVASTDVVDALRDVVGLADRPATNQQRFWAVRRFFEELGRQRPLVVTFDDIHWAEPALLDLIEHITDLARDSSILVLCMARPDLLDQRATWGGGKFNSTTILLEPLDEKESEALVANLAGDVDAEFVGRIADAAEGNPLFVEEMLGMLIDDGVLRSEDGRWIVERVEELRVPPTIHALISSRLDRLSQTERRVIERAAVMGKVFDLRALGRLVDTDLDIASNAASLVRKDLIRPDTTDPHAYTYAFRHLLIQESAYGAMPKETRAQLHASVADWLESESGERMSDYEEIVGHHLERAVGYYTEIGVKDERVPSLRKRAVERLGNAGKRAYARADSPAAFSLLSRAVALASDEPGSRCELLPFLGATHGDQGELADAQARYAETISLAEEIARNDLAWHGRVALSALRLSVDPGGADPLAIREEALEAIASLEGSGNELALTLAWFLVVAADHATGNYGSAMDAAKKASVHAANARQPRQEADAFGVTLVSGTFGPTPIAEVIDIYETRPGSIRSNRLAETWGEAQLGHLLFIEGKFESGREHQENASTAVRNFGLKFGIAGLEAMTGNSRLAAGLWAEGGEHLRIAYELLREIGDEGGAAAAAGGLARAYFREGAYEDAERYTRICDEGLPGGRFHFRSRARPPWALAAAQRGDHDEARRLAQEAVDRAEATDSLSLRGDALLDLAEVLKAAGDGSWEDAYEMAIALFQAKGEHASVARAQTLLT